MATKKRKEPVHRIFYLCSTFTPDEAWADFLKECSLGKFPKGVRFEDHAIKCTRKNQKFVEYVPMDAEKALDVILGVFRDKLGIKTSREKKNVSAKFEKKKEESQIKTWKNAKTIPMKINLLRIFAEKFAMANNMTLDEERELLALLHISVTTKIIHADNIIMESGQVVNILPLRFNPYTRLISMEGHVYNNAPPIQEIPIFFVPVPQEDFESQFYSLLDYHANKITKPFTPSDDDL